MKLLKFMAFFIAGSFITVASAFAQSDSYPRKPFTNEKTCSEQSGSACKKMGLLWYGDCKPGFADQGLMCKKAGYPAKMGYPVNEGGYPATKGYPMNEGYPTK